jgi:NAD(P)-dependent dehydrogenase (short-subunit alcohol dehydrogenase family)
MRYRLDECVPDERLALTGSSDRVQARDTIVLEPAGSGTRITYTAELDFSGPAGAVEPALKPGLTRMGRRAVAGLKQALTLPEAPREFDWRDQLRYRTLVPAAWHFTAHGYRSMPDKGLSEFMDGRTVAITGATSGLGLAAACELARLGAQLVLIGRGTDRLAAATDEIRAFSGCPPEAITPFEANLALMASARDVGEHIRAQCRKLDVLINNAGALFDERADTTEGHERALAIHLLAPWTLTRTLMPALENGGGRVVNVASGGLYAQGLHPDDMEFENEPYDGTKAYARAKRALVAVTEHWAEQHADRNVTFNSMHPGWADTPGVVRSLPAFHRRLRPWLRDARMGADTMVWLANTRAVRQRSGEFWFDRKPAPTAVLPGTRVTADQQKALLEWLQSLAPA